MPVYHAKNNEMKGLAICKTVAYPLKTKLKGPAPPCKAEDEDIIDEAIKYFRANVLFKKFDPQGPGDLIICYLTIFIAEILRVFAKVKQRNAAEKKITAISMKPNFAIPGDKGFPLAGFFKAPQNRSEGEKFRAYFRQLREETCMRMLDISYLEDGSHNKWWIQFAKKKPCSSCHFIPQEGEGRRSYD